MRRRILTLCVAASVLYGCAPGAPSPPTDPQQQTEEETKDSEIWPFLILASAVIVGLAAWFIGEEEAEDKRRDRED